VGVKLGVGVVGVLLLLVILIGGVAAVGGGASSSAFAGPCNYSGQLQGPPPRYVPIYTAAARRYGLGARGASILAAIHKVESDFGRNMGPSSAGAIGQMQFEPSTWRSYGVDANRDGRKDPYDARDAIFSAANYLRASGAPGSWSAAIFAYNHAAWYVDLVLRSADGFAGNLTVSCETAAGPVRVGQIDWNDTSGSWAGSKKFDDAARKLAAREGCSVTSAKRSTEVTTSGNVSDHWTGATHSFAYDFDSCSTAQMDASAKAIASAFALPNWQGMVSAYRGKYRVQLLYRTLVGGDHYSHVHVGIRRYPGPP